MIASLARSLLQRIPFIVVLLIVSEIFVTNELAARGREVGLRDSDIERLIEENSLLREEIASSSSLIAVLIRANEAGFHDPLPGQILTLVPEQLPVALRTR
jgi:hypothetical protein